MFILLADWAAKLPIIVTDVGGNRDFVVEGENGWIVPAKDENVPAQRLLNVIENLLNVGKKGYELVRKKYDWNQSVEKVKKLYQ